MKIQPLKQFIVIITICLTFFFLRVHTRGRFKLVTSTSRGVIPNRLSYPLGTYLFDIARYKETLVANHMQVYNVTL
jgi:hypothetical protein